MENSYLCLFIFNTSRNGKENEEILFYFINILCIRH